MVAKVRVKVGQIEVEYEGDDAFLPDGLLEMIEKISAVLKVVPLESPANGKPETLPNAGKLSTSTIASKLGAKSGSDLAYAAAAHLRLAKGIETFSRSDILDEMQVATAFYKGSFGSNLTAYLDTLTKAGRLNSIGNQTYSMPEAELTDLGKKLAE